MAEYVYPTTTLLSLATHTSSDTGLGTVVSPAQPFRAAIFNLIVTQASTSNATLDVYVQANVTDPSSSGIPYDDFIHFAQVSAAGNSTAQWCRDINPSSSTSLISGLGFHTPAAASLAASTVRHGPIGQNLRVQYVITGSSSMTVFKFGVVTQLWP